MSESLAAGLQLTVLGIGLVFLVLALLWGLLVLILRLDRATDSEPANDTGDVTTGSGHPPAEGAPHGLEPELVSAIGIAVLTHRRQQAAPAMRSHLPGSLPSRWMATGRTRQNDMWQLSKRS